jgi:hypothetical protein
MSTIAAVVLGVLLLRRWPFVSVLCLGWLVYLALS